MSEPKGAPEPVAWRWRFGAESLDHRWHFSETPLLGYKDRVIQPLYTAPQAVEAPAREFAFEVWEGGELYASGRAPSLSEATREAMHYMLDGAFTMRLFEVREVQAVILASKGDPA